MKTALFFHFLLLYIISVDSIYVDTKIKWETYRPQYLSASASKFYTYRFHAHIPVPLSHLPYHRQDPSTRGKSLLVYVRKFSHDPFPKKHIWFITGGPGCATDGIERALMIENPDAAIYIMDNRGLESSEAMCTFDESRSCVANPAMCYEKYKHPPHVISLHETALDYNFVSQMIYRETHGEIYMYVSSYGSILAYRAFKFNPKLYSGILLESFMPGFELSETADLHKHVVDSCLQSDLCKDKFPNDSRKDLEQLMKIINSPSTKNPCKTLFQYKASTSSTKFYTLVSTIVRYYAHKRSRQRGIILPFLYNLAHCPSIDDFVKFTNHFEYLYNGTPIPKSANTSSAETPLMHASISPTTNGFVGAHIRLSEYFGDSLSRSEVCVKQGVLNDENWADVCGMMVDYKPEYRPFLYNPEWPQPKHDDLADSPTRILIFAGKWDTQTPYDFAKAEFDALPVKNKYLFTAKHASHDIIDSHQIESLSLKSVLDFMFTGNLAPKVYIDSLLEKHANDVDRVWQAAQQDETASKALWNFTPRPRHYSYNSFWIVMAGSFVPPLLTFLSFYYNR